ncbi:aspartic peptidase domain-containing protein [Aspergillus karnatakaensis]|uniref:aspartic peptidase domain-containing protein n=1 Tax=Aspergillus karnatakaensis TaxID=1810916 RepID=UPI003CCDAEEE
MMDRFVVGLTLWAAVVAMVQSDRDVATVSARALFNENTYWVNISVGSPPQPVPAALDLREISTSINLSNHCNRHYNCLGFGPENTSLPYLLRDRGLIKTPSFSVWNDQSEESKTGEVLFGGINTAHFTAKDLYKALGIEDDGFEIYGRVYHEVDCDRRSEKNIISFLIGDAVFDIPWSVFIRKGFAPDRMDKCVLQIAALDGSEDYAGNIGSRILRYLYLAVDYHSKTIAFAPLYSNPGEGEIVEMGTEGFPEVAGRDAPAQTETVITETPEG